MATLDTIDIRQFAPLDINTPMVDARARPTPRFIANHQQTTSKLVAQFKNNQAVITSYQQAIVDAMSAGAIKIDSATASFDNLIAGVQVSMTAIVAPAGITARYEIGVSVAGGTTMSAGLIIDLVDEGAGVYSGAVHINANKFTVGDGTNIGDIPFRIAGGVTYIKKAVIEDLSLATSKYDTNSITSSSSTTPSGTFNFTLAEQTVQTLVYTTDNGLVKIDTSIFIGWGVIGSGSYGWVDLRIKKNGTEISKRTVMVDDSFMGQETWFVYDLAPGTTANTYTLTIQAQDAGPTITHYINQGVIGCWGGKK